MKVLFLILILSLTSFAQTKIAVININAFYDEKTGIKELVAANKKLEVEFNPVQEELNKLNEKLKKIVAQIPTSFRGNIEYKNSYLKKVEEQWLEAQKLSNQLNSKAEKAKLEYGKRKAEVIEPIDKRIAEKLEVFKKNRGYSLIIEQSSIDEGAIIIDGEVDEITKEFIKYCNEEFEKEKTQK